MTKKLNSLVSIIVPVYNVAEYITECFNSVASQTFTGGMECIFVDDCGTDDSVDIVRSLISSYHGNVRFRVVNHDHNKGLSAARNTGIREANGDFLYFLDSDDWIYPDCIETMYQKVIEHPDVQCVFAGAKVDQGYPWMDYSKKILPEYSNNPEWIKASMLSRFSLSMTAWNRLISRDFVLKHGLFFADGIIHEDEIWNLILSKHLRSIAICRCNTYYYRLRSTGIIGQEQNSCSKLICSMPAINAMIETFPKDDSDIYARSVFLYVETIPKDFSNPSNYIDYKDVVVRLSKHMNLLHRFCLICWLYVVKYTQRRKLLKTVLFYCLWIRTK